MTNNFDLIRQWAADRNLIKGSNPEAQMEKLYEEVDETHRAIAINDTAEIKDGIGDCVVVLTIMAAQCGMNIEDCIIAAYNEIKDRKGKMVNGIFVKETK